MEEELAINVSWCQFGMPAGVMGVCIKNVCMFIHIFVYCNGMYVCLNLCLLLF